MASAAMLLSSRKGVSPAVRWQLVAKLGRIRSRRRGKKGVREFYLDFRPVGRVWTNHGVRMTDEATARRLLDDSSRLMYEFDVRAGNRELLRGRAVVVLGAGGAV